MSWKSRRSTDGRPSVRGFFFLESLGCAKNQVDSELMIASLEKAGWRYSPDPGEADVLIVNTCGFISSAKKQSIETGLELRSRFPRKRIFIVGCLAERYADELRRELPEFDGFMGNRDPAGIVGLVEGGGSRRPAPCERLRLLSFPGSAYVKVAEGCDNRCSFCAIPLIRGALDSRPRREILEEIKGLLSRGTREIILVAQDLGSYGRDRGTPELALLLRDISELPGRFWVRMLYVHPDHFPRDILAAVREDPRVLPYFDIPFQHASPRVLAAMGRIPEPRKNLDLVMELREGLPGAVLRSTFLVGFPGETEEDFSRLLEFQAEASLDWLGVFAYSREEGTASYGYKGRVPASEARRRKALIEERQVRITERALDRRLGESLEVLVEEQVKGKRLSIGRTYIQAPDVDGLTVIRGSFAGGELVRARVVKRNGLDLEAEASDG
jgi:ribosomal protein S12 methylthiotransferase